MLRKQVSMLYPRREQPNMTKSDALWTLENQPLRHPPSLPLLLLTLLLLLLLPRNVDANPRLRLRHLP
jgi:hypothetical protein